ncbi:hypothetical protein EVJ58_g5821 [Rhodofomes roseus]|uniref:Uncharacterized protein n=1 Tax=Rhodofomes roseus TaxID=34475 RepID=A0A4Y9YCR9_9APHY|nr:hypothetical protein EVJ58_g5821 [Rhodofomes roseus]
MPNLHVKPIVEAHITCYYHLIEVIKAEADVEPCLLPVTRSEWLSWANCVHWMLRALFESCCKVVTNDPNAVPLPYSFNDVIEVMNYIDEVFQHHKLPHDPVGALYPTIAWSKEARLSQQLDHLRCLLYTVQIIANTIKTFFHKQYKRKCAAGPTSQPAGTASEPTQSRSEPLDANDQELQEILEEGKSEAEALACLLVDAGRTKHDEQVLGAIREQVIREMAAEGIAISASEAAAALRVLPKHTAFAKKTRDSGVVRDAFEKEVGCHPPQPLFGYYEHIAARNTTRWDLDYRLLMSSHALRDAIVSLLQIRDLKLNMTKLTAQEWKLSTDLRDMLLCIHELLQRFQQNTLPLV